MSKRVLVVDDEEDVRAIAQLALEMKTDWTVLLARSGKEAIEVATAQHPDVILLDMMMPDMDGRMTLQQLKADTTTQSIPVILVTAKAQTPDQAIFLELEVAGIFAKPFRPLELADQIREALQWA